jgi:hypothetical protein
VFTSLTQGLLEISGEGFGLFGSLRAGLIGLDRHLGCGMSRVRPPSMHEEANQHESDHEKLIKQQVWCHHGIPSHGSERE